MAKRSHRPSRANRPRPLRPRDSLQVTLVAYPHVTGDVSGTLAHDVELAKAAVLYADHVDLISAQASMLSQLATLRGSGLAGVLSLMQSLDDQTLRRVGMNTEQITPEVRALLPTLGMALDDEQFRAVMPVEVQHLYEQLAPAATQFQDVLAEIDDASGAGELSMALDAGLLSIVNLADSDNLVAASAQVAAGSRLGLEAFADTAWAWVQQVTRVLHDPLQRVILDPAAVDIVQSFVDAGLLQPTESTVNRSRAPHLGAGFIGRLPAFPDVPFDELLDMRSELSTPLARYRASIVRMSRTLSASPFERAIEDEADDIWVSTVLPALAEIEDEMTDHGLVRELARTAREDAREIVLTGSGLLIGLEQLGHLSSLVSGAIAAGGVGAGVAGRAINARNIAETNASRAELFYLYRIGIQR
jgi:hypothetical protein